MNRPFANGNFRRDLKRTVVGGVTATALGSLLVGVGSAANDWRKRVDTDHVRLNLVEQEQIARTPFITKISDIHTQGLLNAQGISILSKGQEDIQQDFRELRRGQGALHAKVDTLVDTLMKQNQK